MQLARVIGSVVSSIKDVNLNSHTMLLVQPIDPERAFGRPVVALDSVGAGVGEFVFSFEAARRRSRSIPVSRPPTRASLASSITGIWAEAGAPGL